MTGTAGEWQVTLGSGLYKFDLELGCGDLQVVLDPNAAQSTLLVQGLDQSQYQSREEDFGEIKVVLGSRARQQSDQRFTATLTVPDDGALQELDLSLNAGSITLPDLTLDELDVELNGRGTLRPATLRRATSAWRPTRAISRPPPSAVTK